MLGETKLKETKAIQAPIPKIGGLVQTRVLRSQSTREQLARVC